MLTRNKDVEELLKPVRAAGWRIVQSRGSGHVKFYSSDGRLSAVITMTGNGHHALANIRAVIKKLLTSCS